MAASLLGGFGAGAEVVVTTLGGGPIIDGGLYYGNLDGDTLQTAQFHTPFGCVATGAGSVLVADRDNGKVREVRVAANRTRTLLSGLNQPVAVVVDAGTNVYVLNQGDGTVVRQDRFGYSQVIASGLISPTAMAIDSQTNLFFTEQGGAVKRLNAGQTNATLVAAGFNQPGGIALLESGWLVISESGSHTLRLLDPVSKAVQPLAGVSGTAGFRNGPAGVAWLNRPSQIARCPNGWLVIADSGNHRVRLLLPNGYLATLYGIDPADWGFDNDSGYPGWWDGSAEFGSEFAEARDPVGVAVDSDGTVYVTEDYYHIVRQITGTGLGVTGGGGGGTPSDPVIQALPPVITPNSGYYPFGQVVTVVNPNTNAFYDSVLYYTVDGSEPTTNSLRLLLTNQVGTITWRETGRDLSALRIKAFLSNQTTALTSGQTTATNQIGIPRALRGGPGANLIVPVVVNLRPGIELRSLTYLVEVTPITPGAPVISDQFNSLSLTTNDFIAVLAPAESGKTATYGTTSYLRSSTRGLMFYTLGSAANFYVKDFATVTLLKLPIPAGARLGDQYRIEVLEPTGTSDNQQAEVPLKSLAASSIEVASVAYTVGDSAPGTGYNAGEFGDLDLRNADVNNAFYASLGIRMPFPFSDVYDAMDAFPLDQPGIAGGDGLIRYLDWQIILERALRLDGQNWQRTWALGGVRTVLPANLQRAANQPAVTSVPASNPAWFREALVGATPRPEVLTGGAMVEVPIYLQVRPGYKIAGLQFRVQVIPDEFSPPLTNAIQFVPAPGILAPPRVYPYALNDLSCAWDMGMFNPALQGSNWLGVVRIKLQFLAGTGHAYCVRFAMADGSPDMNTQYTFETRSAMVWVGTPARAPQSQTSDEWKLRFFGSLTDPRADDLADPNQDGQPNWVEYRTGSDPVAPRLRLHVLAESWATNRAAFKLRWFGEAGLRYRVEYSPALPGNTWFPLVSNRLGTGLIEEVLDPNRTNNTRFYRVRRE